VTAVPGRPRLAAVVVGYETRWHADNLVTRLLEGYRIDETVYEPRCSVASVYTLRPSSLSADLAARHGFRLASSIAEALTLGGASLAVDGVVVVTEAPGNVETFGANPFRAFWSEIAAVLAEAGRPVPVFWDKQLAARWSDSLAIHEEARALGVALAAGSVIPATFRRPELDVAPGTPIGEALAVASIPQAHVQSITFHALELLQSFAERRTGGETGVAQVEVLDGPAVWRARDAGRWSGSLFEAAVARSESRREGRPEDLVTEPMAVLLHYRDGFRAAVVSAPGYVDDFTVALRVAGVPEPLSTLAWYASANGNSFACLVRQIEDLMLTGQPPVPVARTLLTSGLIDAMLRARTAGGSVATPELAIGYHAPPFSVYCRGRGR
jgi:hypothetical protein